MDWLKKIMFGRYGGDQLSVFLLILSILITIVGRLLNLPIVMVLAYMPLAITIFRMFSKDVKKRSMENYKFAIRISPIYAQYKKLEKRFKDSKHNKYFKCKNCKKNLRVPRGKGKIEVTCPSCKTRFIKRV
ncbi:hypothetical protein EDC19_1908 [Natranaerovirga hydrolytica]|uniref:Zn-finger containing protein n=1 Tax=Natranaerovirga hydrolytica TaxID=680378 RepID=A0A4R1MS53_9FIRM|nr:hypothetical protein [Natranaerovirga hydrolytica]TCK92753.1 hypothetical protein EDC19_1908 [Natranaerovirga hydrolytica]